MTEEISGRPPQPVDIFWKNTVLELAKESIASIEESARHLIVAASFLEGVYFHAISFADLKPMFEMTRYASLHWLLVLLFSAPILLWLMVLLFAIRALTTKSYTVHPDDPEDAKRIIDEIAGTKQRWVVRGLWLLMGSFVLLFLNIFLFIGMR